MSNCVDLVHLVVVALLRLVLLFSRCVQFVAEAVNKSVLLRQLILPFTTRMKSSSYSKFKNNTNRRLHFAHAVHSRHPFSPLGDAAYRQCAGGGPDHGHRQHPQKLVKIAHVVSEISCRADRQTDRHTDRHTHHNTSPPLQRASNNTSLLPTTQTFWHSVS